MTGRIVVGIDGSVGAERALEWALIEAAKRGAVVRVVHSYLLPVAVEIGVGPLVPTAEEDTAMRSYHRELLDQAVAAGRARHPELTVEAELVEGAAAPTLLNECEQADLLVIGARGTGRLASALLGSVSAEVTHRAACPVVVVPTHDGHARSATSG